MVGDSSNSPRPVSGETGTSPDSVILAVKHVIVVLCPHRNFEANAILKKPFWRVHFVASKKNLFFYLL